MPSPRTCPKCGRPLAAEGAGVCPRCLLGLGLDLGSSFAPGGTGGRSGVLELAGDDLPDALKKARGAPGKSTRGSEAKSELFGSVPGGTDTEPQGRRKKKPGKAGGARPARSKRPSSSKSKRGGEPSADVAPYLATPYRRGDVIGGKYKVYDVLGKGGFGVVYLVYSYEAESVLALKTFRDDLMHDPGARARFMREAQIWVTLGNHPHTVRAYFATEIAGRLYIALEFVAKDEDGLNTLKGQIKRRKYDDLQAVNWAVQFCRGIEHAYARGCRCHRDVKPANIMITQDRRVKITDFGLVAFADAETGAADGEPRSGRRRSPDDAEMGQTSGVLDAAEEGRSPVDHEGDEGGEEEGPVISRGAGGPLEDLGASWRTMQGVGVGTPTHMPPEQFVSAASCDERSDIYSFGIVLYQMASRGKLPFTVRGPRRRTPAALQRYWTTFYNLHRSGRVPEIDVPLWRIIRRCLEKKPERRYQSFKELRGELSEIVRGITGESPLEPAMSGVEAWDWNNRGATLHSLGLSEEAAKCLDRAIRIDPRHAGAWNNKANLLAGSGRFEEALECCEKALAISPHNPAFWSNKGRTLGGLDRFEEAVACFERALEINPRYAAAWTSRARLLEDRGRILDALRCYDRATKVDRQHTQAWVGMGDVLEQLGRHEEAIKRYDRALGYGPSYAVAWNNKGLSLFRQGKHGDAVACYARATELNPDLARAWSNRGAGLIELGRLEEALVCLDRSLELDGKSVSALLNKGNALFRLERYEESAKCCDAAIDLDRHCADAWNNKGNCQHELGRYGEAVACYDRALRIDPDRADTWANKARCFERQGHLRAAARSYDRAMHRDPENALFCARKGNVLVEQGRLNDALVAFDRAVEIDERESAAWCRRGSVLRGLGRLEEALYSLNQAVGLDPENPVFWNNRGNVEAALAAAKSGGPDGPAGSTTLSGRRGPLEEAVRSYNRALRLDPTYVAAWLNKGTCLHRLGLHRRAVKSLDEALRLDPTNARALANKAACLTDMGALDEAIVCCDEAIRVHPDLAAALVNKGCALLSKGRCGEALECHSRALEIAPASPSAWRGRAMAEEALGRAADAARSLEELLRHAVGLPAHERKRVEEHAASLRRGTTDDPPDAGRDSRDSRIPGDINRL